MPPAVADVEGKVVAATIGMTAGDVSMRATAAASTVGVVTTVAVAAVSSPSRAAA